MAHGLPGNTISRQTFGPWDAFCMSAAPTLAFVTCLLQVSLTACTTVCLLLPLQLQRLCARKVPFDAPNIPGLVREIVCG